MADRKDGLEARRWFRQRLAQIARQYPALRDPEHQQRLSEALDEENNPCQDNRQVDQSDGPKEVDS
jgi:hypothetical protein